MFFNSFYISKVTHKMIDLAFLELQIMLMIMLKQFKVECYD